MLAFRHEHLVYIPISKHASTSYVTLFRDKLKWQEVQTDSIDWYHDHVFAHIIHPYERHLKGTVQALIRYRLEHFIDDPKFVSLFTTAIFDLHAYPLSASFTVDQLYKIDWIFLDHATVPGDKLTCKFLSDQGIVINEQDIPMSNPADNQKKELTSRLRELRKDNPLVGELTYFYDIDVVLWNSVNERNHFTFVDSQNWDKCSWLNVKS
jgi:hypothetical protein